MRDLLVTCETPSAIVVHARRLGDGEKPNYHGSNGKTRTLCGLIAGWDTRIDLRGVTCRSCSAAVRAEDARE